MTAWPPAVRRAFQDSRAVRARLGEDLPAAGLTAARRDFVLLGAGLGTFAWRHPPGRRLRGLGDRSPRCPGTETRGPAAGRAGRTRQRLVRGRRPAGDRDRGTRHPARRPGTGSASPCTCNPRRPRLRCERSPRDSPGPRSSSTGRLGLVSLGGQCKSARLNMVGAGCPSSECASDELVQAHTVVGPYHLGRFLADHDRCRVGVAAHHVRHDAGIRDPEIGNPVHPLLLSGHLRGQGAILVYRVQDYAATVARLRGRNLAVHELEIPHGPCATFTMEAGQRYAVYQLVRPDAVHLFDGRIDP